MVCVRRRLSIQSSYCVFVYRSATLCENRRYAKSGRRKLVHMKKELMQRAARYCSTVFLHPPKYFALRHRSAATGTCSRVTRKTFLSCASGGSTVFFLRGREEKRRLTTGSAGCSFQQPQINIKLILNILALRGLLRYNVDINN